MNEKPTEYKTPMTLAELKEQIQQDIISCMDVYAQGVDIDDELVDALCQIVVDNFNTFNTENKF